MNLQANSAGPYDACPYCLTEITADNELISACDEPKEIESAEEKQLVEKTVDAPVTEKAVGCQNHLGYLSERSSKDQIPDECMMCKDIVECMLLKMKG
jgi:hypothetical protein